MLIVRAPVRISYFGGGTDLPSYYNRNGGAVISAAINKYFYVLITQQPDKQVQIISADLKAMQTLDDLSLVDASGELQLPLAAIQSMDLDRGANIFLASEIRPGTGLGSSGAVAVCLVKALSSFMGRHMDRYAVAEQAYYINNRILGHPGGKQDEYGAAFPGLKHIEFRADGVDVHPLNFDTALLDELAQNTLLFFTGQARESAEILDQQKSAVTGNNTNTIEALDGIRAMVDQGIQILERGDLRAFGELLHEAWETKKRVAAGVTTPYIDELYNRAREAGAIGGKIAGAGGGGFIMIYCEPPHQPGVIEIMQKAGARQMLFHFDYDGVHVVHDDPFFGSNAGAGSQWRLVEAPDA